jgi:hypothetical protein
MFLFGVTLLVGLGQGAAAQKIEIEEVDIEKQSATPEQPAHFSLLDDGHDDKIFSFRSPDYFSVETYRVAVIADANSLVPIERLEQEDDGGERIKYFLFHRSTHGDCHLAGVKFFRKIADGKVAGFYAIQWDRWLGDACRMTSAAWMISETRSSCMRYSDSSGARASLPGTTHAFARWRKKGSLFSLATKPRATRTSSI